MGLFFAGGQAGVKLKTTPFPDGTGSIGLPGGWQMTETYRGSCTCVGPDGEAVVLGIPWVILRPDSSLRSLPASEQQPMAYPGDLKVGLREVLAKKARARLLSLRVRDAPPAIAGAPAMHALYDYEQNGKVFTALTYMTALDYGASSPAWQLYASAVIAPKAGFAKRLPLMLAMWKSWRPNGQAPRKGSESAKFDEMLRERKNNFEKFQAEFRKLL